MASVEWVMLFALFTELWESFCQARLECWWLILAGLGIYYTTASASTVGCKGLFRCNVNCYTLRRGGTPCEAVH